MHIFRVSKGINLRVSIGVKLQNTTCLRHGIIYWLWPLPYLMLNTFTHCQYPPAAIGILPIDFPLSVWDRGTRLKNPCVWSYTWYEMHTDTMEMNFIKTRKQGMKKAVLPPEKLHMVGYLVQCTESVSLHVYKWTRLRDPAFFNVKYILYFPNLVTLDL